MKTPKADTFPLIIKKQHAHVKIYKGQNRGKDLFTLSYISPSGRIRKNFFDLAEAKREADTQLGKMAKGDLEALKLTGLDAQLFVAATEALKPCGVSLDIAAREFASAFEILGFDGIIEAARHYKATVSHGLPDVMVADAADRFYSAKKSEGMSPKYLKDIRQILGAADRDKKADEQKARGGLSGTFHCNLKAVSSDQLREYIGRMKVGPVAKNNHRRVIVALFNFAKEQTPAWLSKNETTAADAIGNVKVRRKPPTIYTPAEMAALLSGSSERFLPYLALIAFGGVRADEITDDEAQEGQSKGQLKWEHIDFVRGVVTVPAEISKTIARKITMSANLRAWLAPYRDSTGFIFDVDPSTERAKACEAAGVILYGKGKNARRLEWKPNAHRHSFASYRLESTKSAAQVSLEMGNSPKIVLRDYADLVHAEDAAAYWGIAPVAEEGKVVEMAAVA